MSKLTLNSFAVELHETANQFIEYYSPEGGVWVPKFHIDVDVYTGNRIYRITLRGPFDKSPRSILATGSGVIKGITRKYVYKWVEPEEMLVDAISNARVRDRFMERFRLHCEKASKEMLVLVTAYGVAQEYFVPEGGTPVVRTVEQKPYDPIEFIKSRSSGATTYAKVADGIDRAITDFYVDKCPF